ncbi:MAG: hypothetical protein MJA29_07995 [Candidatus Omnitrophica bacterium]|nr:hypothetical protein [Candidatus Omnitrophota bacterium]
MSLYFINDIPIDSVSYIRDLGIIISNNFKFEMHINHIIKCAYYKINLILRNFVLKDPIILTRLYILYVRPILCYLSEVWNPQNILLIERIEKVQSYFTKRICPNIASYKHRLEFLNLESLELFRLKNDLIVAFKIIKGFSILEFNDFFALANLEYTRGHTLKLAIPRVNKSLPQQDFLLELFQCGTVYLKI